MVMTDQRYDEERKGYTSQRTDLNNKTIAVRGKGKK
jgi:hypothetical protein